MWAIKYKHLPILYFLHLILLGNPRLKPETWYYCSMSRKQDKTHFRINPFIMTARYADIMVFMDSLLVQLGICFLVLVKSMNVYVKRLVVFFSIRSLSELGRRFDLNVRTSSNSFDFVSRLRMISTDLPRRHRSCLFNILYYGTIVAAMQFLAELIPMKTCYFISCI